MHLTDITTTRFLHQARIVHHQIPAISVDDALTDVHIMWAASVSGRIPETSVHAVAHDAYLRLRAALGVDVEDAEDTYTADDIDRHLARLVDEST